MNRKKQTAPGYLEGAKAIGEFLAIPTRRVFTLIKSGRLPVEKEDGEYVVAIAVLQAFMDGDFLTDGLKAKPDPTTTIADGVARMVRGKTSFSRTLWPTGAGRPAGAPMPYLPTDKDFIEPPPEPNWVHI